MPEGPLMVVILAALGLLVALAAAFAVVSASRARRAYISAEMSSIRSELQDSISQSVRHINSQLIMLSGQVAEELSAVTAQMSASSGQMNSRMDNSNRTVSEIKQALGELSKATEQVYEVGRSISGLEKVLSAPKARGGLGELFLSELLSECLPSKRFELQYGFRDGARVDAVVRLREGLVPIDSKFPLDNFRRIVEAGTDEERRAASRRFSSDCRRHIDSIASAYIRPSEGTLDFALMYVPSESVYYELITGREECGAALSEYAVSKKVVPVSPNSFYAYLQTIAMGLRGMEIEARAGEMLAHLSGLRGEFEKFSADLETLGRHLSFARSKYDELERKAGLLSERLDWSGLGRDSELRQP
ncbi:MAG: DNA recombination protein RmuC [Thermodesulfobacteriota bacterium]|nr:MAG: DNA recombination protein RmuC [Thermodesulfobacteriota bacterium]